MSAKHYFVCGHTAKGYINLFSSNLEPLNKLFILKGGPGAPDFDVIELICNNLYHKMNTD